MLKFLYEKVLRPVLFLMNPETAHSLSTSIIRLIHKIPVGGLLLRKRFSCPVPELSVTVSGLQFPGPVGLAAGFDKSGDLYPSFSDLGFDFIESGTFTALAQEGNPRPRMFRYPEAKALVNRMGFNNPGAKAAGDAICLQRRKIPRGINIGKSKITPVEEALDDYRESLRILAGYGDYVAINVSSPNTPGLRTLQLKENLSGLLRGIQETLRELESETGKMPLFVKIAPDLTDEEFSQALEVVEEEDLAGIIISNTTIDHSSVPRSMNEAGGLSGSPLRDISTQMIRKAFLKFRGSRTIIGVGGIMSEEDAWDKLAAGADLIQIYTGYIYGGPDFPCRIKKYLFARLKKDGLTIKELRGYRA